MIPVQKISQYTKEMYIFRTFIYKNAFKSWFNSNMPIAITDFEL